jgi:DNA invertase Pin-like site-specific DNA recombinase
MNKPKTALYCRLAVEDNNRLAEQERNLFCYAEDNGYANCICYRDNGQSGVQRNRPELKRLLNDIRAHAVERVIVSDIARLSRSFIETSELLELFSKYNVEFISVGDGYANTTRPQQWLRTNWLSWHIYYEGEMC